MCPQNHSQVTTAGIDSGVNIGSYSPGKSWVSKLSIALEVKGSHAPATPAGVSGFVRMDCAAAQDLRADYRTGARFACQSH